mmetsp:Transcript_21770/g.32420  ORF Transcript_21770/g.32420 Transcript_21770/m.32420 type:complete len:81 (+) Transcript_21770:136-378(+)
MQTQKGEHSGTYITHVDAFDGIHNESRGLLGSPPTTTVSIYTHMGEETMEANINRISTIPSVGHDPRIRKVTMLLKCTLD